MKKIVFLFLVTFPFLTFSQVAITFSDEFNLEEESNYDNWQYDSQSFFVLPLSINDYIAIENFQFNITYNPQEVQLNVEIIDAINDESNTSPYNVLSAISGQQGSITAEVFDLDDNQSVATVSYSHTAVISESQFDNGYAVLIYLPFKKINACSKAPKSISFTNGNIDGQFANPNQTSAFIINQTISYENGGLITQDALVNFNLLSADVIQNGNALESFIDGGTPPYTYEWTDKMDVVLSTDSFYAPGQTGDYLLYVYDQNNCSSILYVSYDQTASIDEASAFSIYPIPARNDIEVVSSSFNYYKLINNKGIIVDFGKFSNKARITRNELPPGIYFLQLSNDSRQSTSKVLFN